MRHLRTINVKSTKAIDFIDITREVRRFMVDERVKYGVMVIYTPHTTAGITINENADPAVRDDIEAFLQKNIPDESYFRHAEGNSRAHIMSSYFGVSETIIIDSGELLLGTWQGIYFCDFDGPRTRKVHIKIVPDSDY